MSGLVSYDSSSEEESSGPITTRSQPLTPKHTTDESDLPSRSLPADINSSKNETKQAPILGPTMPEINQDPLYEDEPQFPESMPERDIIRYLTQVTHPMAALPDSPPGSPDPAVNAKMRKFLDLKSQGVHFNADLASKATFRNPSLLTNMMARTGTDGAAQYGTTLSPSVWDLSILPPFAYKEELLRSQQNLRDQESFKQKALSSAGKRTIEFTSEISSANGSRTSTPGQQSKRRKG